ncbi:hypothetical protein CspHIS471_0301040 [Cutaneotrichosporon sp. HIS471]|nr:hypothetical protein CspHIS471_0301040 [Cutaneotrichosporon sp. HIS471]
MPGSKIPTSLASTYKMLDGREIPTFGLGVYEMSDGQTRSAVAWALEAGYRHIDTAEWYENEGSVGDAKHIEEIVERGDELPVVNQIDLHPFMRHKAYVENCQKHGIILEAWAPLARAMRFQHPVIETVADKYSKTPAQVHLRWGLQHGYIVIPKSASRNRIIENADLFDFELSAADMEQLDGLDENLITDWDITTLD